VIMDDTAQAEIDAMARFCLENGLQLQRINHYALYVPRAAHQSYHVERPLPCDLCNRLRLTADGKLKPCLFTDTEVAIDFADIGAAFRRAVELKPACGQVCTTRGNWQIGG
jgi:GTP 3',8-cyclase